MTENIRQINTRIGALSFDHDSPTNPTTRHLSYDTLNPLFGIPNPAEGRYSVFVGRVLPIDPVNGTLTITESAEAAPAELQTEGN